MINYYVPSTYRYTVYATSMYSNNMWVENQALEVQMWMQQGEDCKLAMSTVDYAQNYWDEFEEEYPEYIKAVLLADLDK
ncbi:hypothetical protein DFH08DRAFT_975493 [Mycena albidolilacea]|uniref:Uncharacterized protein n=1 Tax=Mycena albidolilacea TaxID=1033008 RepID=A0AAD7EB55_9AGAR|nr:hypothetical protein DFH08DRAFT_975493 [Mycena albidolilacea]